MTSQLAAAASSSINKKPRAGVQNPKLVTPSVLAKVLRGHITFHVGLAAKALVSVLCPGSLRLGMFCVHLHSGRVWGAHCRGRGPRAGCSRGRGSRSQRSFACPVNFSPSFGLWTLAHTAILFVRYVCGCSWTVE